MKRESFLPYAVLIAVVATLAGGLGVAQYKECRRLHPWWYCIGGGR